MEFDLKHAIALLSRTPEVLRTQLAELPSEFLTANEGGNTWSTFDVIGHLIHGERTDWIPRAKIILGDGVGRTFDTFDRFAQFKASKGKSIEELLSTFDELRRENIRTLEALNLNRVDLKREGTHPELGRVTLEQLLATWVAHDLDHLVQISRVVARQYEDAVGPWRAYLSVLNSK
jgi:hypothetical protein